MRDSSSAGRERASGGSCGRVVFAGLVTMVGGNAGAADPEVQNASTRDRHVETRSYGTKTESEPPPYVRTPSSIDWLDVGLDLRMRHEYRDSDFARSVEALDFPVLMRTRGYFGIKNVFDPLRFAVELEDGRIFNSVFPEDDGNTNAFEPIQLIGELYFCDGLGPGQPISIRGGRIAFEQVDRRLIGRNGWRNTTNTFQGGRVVLGETRSPWMLDLFALQPLERLLYDLDRPIEGQWLFGAVGSWRRWSPMVTLQPYYLRLQQRRTPRARERDVHTMALRGFGLVPRTAIDVDVSVAVQRGRNAESERHEAWGLAAEAGYTFAIPWRFRLGASYAHASGDRAPQDGVNNRLDRYFGFARPFSNNIYFQWENVRTPKLRLELEPLRWLWLHGGYGAFWLDSPTDRWRSPGLRDPTGRSGRFLGHELDAHARSKVMPRLDLNVGYAWFRPGEHPRALGRTRSSHFLYLELIVRGFE